MERCRAEHDGENDQWKPLRRGWCLGTEQFRERMLALVEGQMGDHHSGELKQESAEAKAERIIAEELRRLGWNQADLQLRLKSDPNKVQIAARLRKETTLSVKWIAARLHLGTWKSAKTRRQSITTQPNRHDEVLMLFYFDPFFLLNVGI